MKRNTIQRNLVLEAVNDIKNHPTAEEIYSHIGAKYSGISVGTVYRNLKSLAEDGKIKRVCVPGTADRFDYLTKPHYHMKCRICGNVFDVFMEYLTIADEIARSLKKHKIEGHEIIFGGVCEKCGHEGI